MRDNMTVTEMDMRGNQITTYGMLTLVNDCLLDTSRVELLDLQQNQVTLDGLLSCAFLLLAHSGRPELLPPVSRSLARHPSATYRHHLRFAAAAHAHS